MNGIDTRGWLVMAFRTTKALRFFRGGANGYDGVKHTGHYWVVGKM